MWSGLRLLWRRQPSSCLLKNNLSKDIEPLRLVNFTEKTQKPGKLSNLGEVDFIINELMTIYPMKVQR